MKKIQIEPIEGKYDAEKIIEKLNEIQQLKDKKDLERILKENGNGNGNNNH